jgi:outer membrane protein assembly factor BamB
MPSEGASDPRRRFRRQLVTPARFNRGATVKQQPKVPVPVGEFYTPLTAHSVFRTIALAALVAILATAGGCRGRKPEAKATGEPPALALQTFARQWATNLTIRGETLRALHVRNETIYAYTDRGRAVALARDSGSIQFSRPIQGGRTLLHAPVEMNEKLTLRTSREDVIVTPVVFPTATTIEILEKGTGRFITSADLKFTIRSDAVGRGGVLYLGGAYRGSSRAAAVDIREPYVPIRWELMTPGAAVSATPALFEDAVYFGGEDGAVYAVSTAAREPIWPLPGGVFQTGAPIVGDLTVDNDNVYVASTDNKLYAINRNNGKLRWQYFGSSSMRTGPAVSSDTVYQFVPGTGLVAIDKAQGEFIRKPRWVAQDATQLLAQDERNAYVRSRGNRIVALDKKTGEVRFTSQRDFAVFGTNLVKEDGIVYAATKKGRVVAVRPVLKPGTVGEVVMMEVGEE